MRFPMSVLVVPVLVALLGCAGAGTSRLAPAMPDDDDAKEGAGSPDQVAESHRLTRIAPGIWFREGDLEGHGHCNNGFVIFDDFVLVIDANFPDGAEECLADIRKTTDVPVRFVFDTHHHGDHAYGNPVWAREGAVPVAHAKVAEEMERYEPGRWQETDRPDVKALEREGPMPPTLRFLDRLVADDGSRRVEFLHFGTAHTRGDGFAWLPKEKVLFTGDAVVNGPYNYMGDGDTGSWLDVLDALDALHPETVAPGHGPIADGKLIERQRAYIAFLRDAVAKGIRDGKTLDEIRSSVEVPEDLRLYVGPMLPDQIAKIHSELERP